MSPRRLNMMVQELRARHDMSQRELAKRAGVSDGYIAHLETGLRKNPSLAVLKRLAKALKVSLAELVK
jgi:transcriptional regulator with XRE-family HTH domain